MKTNYYTIHRNKQPKKAKYSKPYSKLQLEKMKACKDFFIEEVEKIKNHTFLDCTQKFRQIYN